MEDLRREIVFKQEKIHQENQMKRSEDLFCRKCVRYFASKSEFCQHVQEHIEETNDGKTSYMSYIEKFICTSCGQQFEVKSDLIIHYNTVCLDAAYTCKHCKENCKNDAFLQMHLLVHHKYSEEMLRDEGFLSNIGNNPYVSENSFMECSRSKAFIAAPPEDTLEFHTADNSTSPKASSSNSKSRRFQRKRKNLVYNSVNKAHTCEICNESFSRKCVLDIHAKKHVLKRTKEKRMDGSILQKSSIMKSCENTMQESKKIDSAEVPGHHYDSLKALLKPCNVVVCSLTGTKFVPPKIKLPGVKTYTSPRLVMRKSKISDIFEDKGKGSSTHKNVSRPSDVVAENSTWKKIKLRSRIPNFAASSMQNDPENSKKKIKLRNITQDIAASVEQEGPEALKKNVKRRSKIKKAATSDEQKYPETSDVAMKSKSGKAKKIKLRNKNMDIAASVEQEGPEALKKNVKRRSKTKNATASDEQTFSEIPNIAMNPESRKAKEHKKPPQNLEKKDYICETCKKQFPDNFHLKRHFLIHTGERPYTCTKCKKTFTRDDHMKRHLKRVCNKTGNSK